MAEETEPRVNARKVREGLVVSDKMDKTVAVEVIRRVKHARYHKYVNRRNVYKAHDEANACAVGDTVSIQESRPLSRTKRWLVIEHQARIVALIPFHAPVDRLPRTPVFPILPTVAIIAISIGPDFPIWRQQVEVHVIPSKCPSE